MEFTHEPNKISLIENEKTLAKVTFPNIDSDTVDIEHTFVDNSLRGQGVADKLLESVAAELNSQNKKAVLTCSYAVKWFEKHPEHSNLLK